MAPLGSRPLQHSHVGQLKTSHVEIHMAKGSSLLPAALKVLGISVSLELHVHTRGRAKMGNDLEPLLPL